MASPYSENYPILTVLSWSSSDQVDQTSIRFSCMNANVFPEREIYYLLLFPSDELLQHLTIVTLATEKTNISFYLKIENDRIVKLIEVTASHLNLITTMWNVSQLKGMQKKNLI